MRATGVEHLWLQVYFSESFGLPIVIFSSSTSRPTSSFNQSSYLLQPFRSVSLGLPIVIFRSPIFLQPVFLSLTAVPCHGCHNIVDIFHFVIKSVAMYMYLIKGYSFCMSLIELLFNIQKLVPINDTVSSS